MNERITDAGTKYLAMSCSPPLSDLLKIFRLMMPRRHLLLASNTPDPEFPVLATSLITVENLNRTLKGSIADDMMCERTV